VGSLDLDSFRNAEDVLKNKDGSALELLLSDLVDNLIIDMRKEMARLKINASYQLAQSLQVKEEPTNVDGLLTIETEANHYWKYINYGVNGILFDRGAPTHGKGLDTGVSFKQAIDMWITEKGVEVPEELERDEYIFLIINKIRNYGQAPRPFYDNVVTDKRIKQMSKEISFVIGKSIKTAIKKPN
jgi:hypothetical protein